MLLTVKISRTRNKQKQKTLRSEKQSRVIKNNQSSSDPYGNKIFKYDKIDVFQTKPNLSYSKRRR